MAKIERSAGNHLEPVTAENILQLRQEIRRGNERVARKYKNVMNSRLASTLLGNFLLRTASEGVALFADGRLAAANRRFYELCGTTDRFSHPTPSEKSSAYGLLTLLGVLLEDLKQRADACTAHHFLTGDRGLHLELSLELLETAPDSIAIVLRDVSDNVRMQREREETRLRDGFFAQLAKEVHETHGTEHDAASLIGELFDLTQAQQGKLSLHFAMHDLRSIIQKAVTAFASLRAHDFKLSLALPARPVSLLLDGARISQCVTGLLAAAARLTARGGQITVCLEIDQQVWLRIRIPCAEIAPDVLARLSLARRLLEMHGGGMNITADSAQKQCEISMFLPANEAIAPSETAPDLSADQAASLRVLFIDDNEDLCQLMSFLLAQAGHTVIVAKDGRDGFDAALREQPDVVVCDLGLPRLDGLALASQLRQQRPQLPLIALSGYADIETQARATEVGFVRYFIKPIPTEDLLHAIVQLAPKQPSANGSS